MISALNKRFASVKFVLKDGLYRRLFKNVAMLTGGKGAAAILGLGYLAIATHTLGVHQFGILILIHIYVVVIREFTSFSTSHSVIRYGAACLKDNNRDHFQSLIKFTLLLDMGSAIIGTLIAVLLMPVAGHWFSLTAEMIPMATLYCFAILFNFKSTSIGTLRLFNRFDLLAKHMLVIPTIRLIGASIAFMTDADVLVFLLVWFIAGSVSTFVVVYLAWRELNQQGFLQGMNTIVNNLTTPHPGIWSFVWNTNIHITLNLTVSHISTLAVGIILGPSSAGLFNIAQKAANILVKPAKLFTETIYPDLAKLTTYLKMRDMWRVIVRAGLIGTAVAGIVTLIIIIFGKSLLIIIFGAEFIGSYQVLILLILAGAITMSTFAFDPALYAIGRPDIPMKIKVLTSMLHILVTLYLLIFMGLIGAGIAAIISGIATALLLVSYSMRLLRYT